MEDENLTRSALAAALEKHGALVSEPARSGASAIESFERHRHHAAVLDLDLGHGPSGVDLAFMLRSLNPRVGIVILTSYEDPRLFSKSTKRLPKGTRYLVKQTLLDSSELFGAVVDSINLAVAPHSGSDDPTLRGFTAVQIETMQMIAQGLSNQEIARNREVGVKSVEKSVTAIAQKLELLSGPNTNTRVSIAKAYSKLIGGKL